MKEPRKSLWLLAMDRVVQLEKHLPQVWPPELPPEQTPGFWFHASQLEMTTRDSVSALLRSAILTPPPPQVSPLEGWMIRRRLEWAGQILLSQAQLNVEQTGTVEEALLYALVRTWESDGCIGMWIHAERGGQPHPDNPDGLTPLKKRPRS